MSNSPLLEVCDLQVRYGAAQAVLGVSFELRERDALALLGPNGAGKSTIARAISGLVATVGGSVRFDGRDITGWAPSRIRRAGLVHLPEGRGVFAGLSVLENLRMGATLSKSSRKEAIERALSVFPVLGERRRQQAGTLSGGEQQMLSLARALMISPKLVIADEMSLGLAPQLVDVVFESLQRARSEGVTVLMVEQFAHRALDFCDTGLILQRGRVAWSGRASDAGGQLLRGYLGESVA